MARRLGRVLLAAVVGAIALAAPAAAGGAPMPARIVAEWEPGRSAAEVGGRITVDGYGVDGLGLYRLGDGPASWLAVCVQADIGHSLAADYRRDPEPVVASAELEYLLWRYVAAEIADDSEAAALNVLSWRYAGARRRSGGPVWTGERIDVAVVGGPALTDVEADVAALAAEAGARRGPWALVDLTAADGADGGGVIPVALRGPGGPIAGIEVHVEAGATTSVATTDADGVATVRRDAAVTGPVVATASGPGPLVTWSASGSQRLAAPGPPVTVR